MSDIPRIGLRHDTEANWGTENPTLLTDETVLVDDLYEVVRGTNQAYNTGHTSVGYLGASPIPKMIKEQAHDVGEFFFRGGVLKAPAGWTAATPTTYWPGLCLDTINTYTDIAAANWPDLVTELRTWKLGYLEGLTGGASAYTLSAWSITSNVATLTFASNAANTALFLVIAEIFLTLSDYPVVNIAATIGNIAAGDYRLTGSDSATRTITFAITASNGSGSTTDTVEIYTNRIPGSTTTARVYGAKGMALMSAGTSTHMSGGHRRSYMQGHYHNLYAPTWGAVYVSQTGASGGTLSVLASSGLSIYASSPVTDGTNGTPRTGTETEPRSVSAHLYIWGGSYTA